VNIHSDGRYGFVEFRSPEYASAALQLNGQINLMGQALSIGRPASYVDPNKVSAGGGGRAGVCDQPAIN
jgi:splicing factor U2AF subunit